MSAATDDAPVEGAIDIENGKIGFLYVKCGKKKYRYTWVALQGSSFYTYKDAKDTTPSSVYQLKGTSVNRSPTGEETDFPFLVLDGASKLVVGLAGSSQADRDVWADALEHATALEPAEPPSKEKVKKKSAAFRLKKAAAGKIAVSGVGKKAMKTAVNEETKLLIDSLKTIVCKVHDQRKADEIEDHLIKIILKCFLLERNGDITMEDFLKADAPLREAFEVLIHMRDCRHRMSAERASENLRKVHLLIQQVENIITSLLTKHLKPNSIKRVAVAFGLLGSIEFLTAGWSDESLENERDMLSDAMNRYTAFHFN